MTCSPLIGILRATVFGIATTLVAASSGWAQSGITNDTIVLGQSTTLSGPLGDLGQEVLKGSKAYFDAHVKKFGAQKEPDRWASGATWAALEILTAAVGKVGLDRKAIRDYVAGNEHSTILGKIKFAGSENVGTPGTVSQWQKGEFEVVWPKANATAPLVASKPAWV